MNINSNLIYDIQKYIYIILFRSRKKLKTTNFAKKWNWFFGIPLIYFLLFTIIRNSWKFSIYANFGHLNLSLSLLKTGMRKLNNFYCITPEKSDIWMLWRIVRITNILFRNSLYETFLKNCFRFALIKYFKSIKLHRTNTCFQ